MERERDRREITKLWEQGWGGGRRGASAGTAWLGGGSQQTGSLSTPFPAPHLPASTTGAPGRGAGQAGDRGGAEQPHRGESAQPLPCPGETPPLGPRHPVGAKAGGCRAGSWPGLRPPWRLWGTPTHRTPPTPPAQGPCWAPVWPGPGPPLLSPAAAAPATVSPCSPRAPHPSPHWPGGWQCHGAAGPVRSPGRPGSAGRRCQGRPGRRGGRGTQR